MKKAKYQKIYAYYRGLIRSELLKNGDFIPPEHEIEKDFGVSRITVSKALGMLQSEGLIERKAGSGTRVICNATRRIGNQDRIVTLIIPFKAQGREIDLIDKMEQGLAANDYQLVIHNSRADVELEQTLIHQARRSSSGIIIYPYSSNSNLESLHSMFIDNYPFLCVDRYPFSIPCSYVVSDNYRGGYEIGKYLINRGFRSIALLFHDLTRFSSEKDRYEGFISAARDFGISRKMTKIFTVKEYETAALLEKMLREFLLTESNIKAGAGIFACNDVLASRVIDIVKKNAFPVPESFVVAGFDDIIDLEQNISFITIRQDHGEIGRHAADIIVDLIEKDSFHCEHLTLPIRLVKKGKKAVDKAS